MNAQLHPNIDEVIKDAEEAKKIIADSLKHIELFAGEFKDLRNYHSLIVDRLKANDLKMLDYQKKYPNSRFFEAFEIKIAAAKSLPPDLYKQSYIYPHFTQEELRLLENGECFETFPNSFAAWCLTKYL